MRKERHVHVDLAADSNPPGKIISGEILYMGEDLLKKTEKQMRKIRGNDISMIFQEPMTSLNPVFTVGRQVSESLIFHQDMDKKSARQKAIEMLKLVEIPDADLVVDPLSRTSFLAECARGS